MTSALKLTICAPDHRLKGWSKRRWHDFQEKYPRQAATVNAYVKAGFGLKDITTSHKLANIEMERQSFLGDPNAQHTTWIEAKKLTFYDLNTKKPKLIITNRMMRMINDGPLQTLNKGAWI